MSGLEVVGALASVVQLVSFVAEIMKFVGELYKKLRNAPKILRRHLNTVEQLRDVVLLLQSNEWLRTKAIVERLESIAGKIKEALALLLQSEAQRRSFLWKLSKRTQMVCQYFQSEGELDALFIGLEEMKSNLILCVLNTQVRQSGQASQDTIELLGQMKTEFADLRTFLGSVKASSLSAALHDGALNSRSSIPSSNTFCTSESLVLSAQGNQVKEKNRLVDLRKIPYQECGYIPEQAPSMYGSTLDKDMVGNTYRSLSAADNSRQVNGNIMSGDSDGNQHRYIQNNSIGSSFQINGNVCSGAEAFWSSLSAQSR